MSPKPRARPFKWRCPDCQGFLSASSQQRLDRSVSRHVCLSPETEDDGEELFPPDPEKEEPAMAKPSISVDIEPVSPSGSGTPTQPLSSGAPPPPAPPPPPKSDDLSQAILILAQQQKTLSDNQAGMFQILQQQAEAQKGLAAQIAQSSQDIRWLREKAEPYAQGENGGNPNHTAPAGGQPQPPGGVNMTQIMGLLSMLKGGGEQAGGFTGFVSQATQVAETFSRLRDIFASAAQNPSDYSMGQRDTADLFGRAYKLGIDPDKMSQAIISQDDDKRARRAASATPPAPVAP